MRIILVCAYGMSTSLLMKKMKAAAEAEGIALEVSAHAPLEVQEAPLAADIIMLGPQVAYHRAAIQKCYPNIPVETIDMLSYGMMDGKKVLHDAMKLVDAAGQ
ncbi:MAG TPA: PTS sugar transporter subunit IIB [Pseudoflavonifractor sp.]|nr:PTS sugar transporter subunit IIB [Pseudoflavonifractor sp.]